MGLLSEGHVGEPLDDEGLLAPEGEPDDIEEAIEDAEALALRSDKSGARLDRWLAEQLPERSRAEVQRWIAEGLVTRAGKPLKASARVKAGDEYAVRVPPTLEYHVEPEPIPLEILYEDDDLLVINKPAGMVVHPAPGHWNGTLVNAVLYHCPALAGVGGTGRPGIVHRLDKDTSGLILVAKNDRAHRSLQAQFRGRTIEKVYTALVYGQMQPPEGEIQAPIGRDPQQRKRMAIVPATRGRAAVTRYDTLRNYGLLSAHGREAAKYTLLECHPLTGRTHQIRVHLAFAKHPIVGDEVYGGRRNAPIRCPRQFLHAARIRFRLPHSTESLEFTAPLPADLQAVLDRLENAL